ncbi:extracellular glycosyl hydrolase family 78 protein [Xylaria bambusicola]|uniref:extracellular glycosyl hydrolase family 78 protein n=1 Tax=Xylaria bambusicola TaxID=326684 RepID=UPI00200727AE|nr:extracellular glycosyl hydrolase family 78 protein [Xylaria bambusicola]KAI0513298.1 extracellular glycosyl hydrolase family 78 protein [Xylaria bambusicola]
MAVSISQVSFEHHRVALGIGEASPRISWRFEGDAGNWTQSGYSIEVSRQGTSDVFNFTSSDSVLVDWPTVALTSAESAIVRVRSYGGDSGIDTDWSDPVSVETGLLSDEDWAGAQMIAADKPTEQGSPHQPILFRKDFSLDGNITSARLYITAEGVYEAFINGQRVGDAVLAPGWQSYQHRLVYDTYDVTNLLEDSSNTIGIHVGEGWYSGRIGFETTRNIWGDTLGAFALLVVTDADGSSETIATDLTWSSSTGAITTSEIYDGEYYDTAKEQSGWATSNFMPPANSSNWIGVKAIASPLSRLVAPDGPPIRRLEEVELQEIITTPSGATVLDFGQNLVGLLRLNVSGPAGTKIKMVHVEVLEHGEIATAPLRTAKQTDTLVLSGNGTQTWEPTFTYHGFRYVQVNNWPTEQTPLSRDSVKAIVVHSDMQRTGEFETSDSLLNKLVANILWSLKGNFMSVPTDCPQRDERLGWTGDAHAFSPTANFLYDAAGFWKGWLKDVVSETLENNGIVPVVVPNVPAVSPAFPAAVWGDVVVANAWNMYQSTGDLAALREQFVGVQAWIDHGIPRGANGLWDHSFFQYGDWLDPKAPNDNPGGATTDSGLVADAYLVYVTDLASRIAAVLGLQAETAQYAEQTATLKKAYQAAWISSSGTVAYETQTGIALSLYFDLFPPGTGQDVAAAARLQKLIADNDYLVGTGFAGTHLLGLALTQYGLTAEFYKMLLQTTVPSWLYQVVEGGTTTWERWDSLLPDGTVNPNMMTSFNHYAFGSVANWMFRTIGGLAPAEPGWKTVRVEPVPGGNLTYAKTSYLSPYGRVSTEWTVDDGGFHLTLVVPPNAKAEVVLPGDTQNVVVVGSGTHSFKVLGS